MGPSIRDAFRLAQYNGIQRLSHVNHPGKPITTMHEGVIMLQQVLSEGAQGSQALIRNTLRPEEHPPEISQHQDRDQRGQGSGYTEVGGSSPTSLRLRRHFERSSHLVIGWGEKAWAAGFSRSQHRRKARTDECACVFFPGLVPWLRARESRDCACDLSTAPGGILHLQAALQALA